MAAAHVADARAGRHRDRQRSSKSTAVVAPQRAEPWRNGRTTAASRVAGTFAINHLQAKSDTLL
jgi:hypothetical protein